MKPSAVYRNRMQRYADERWLIWSNKWGCWYRPNCAGYTRDLEHAGIYDRETAARHYLGNVPRKHRDVEPFPVSAAAHMLRRRAEELREQAAAAEQSAKRLAALVGGQP